MSVFVDPVVRRDNSFIEIDIATLVYKAIDFSLGSFEELEALIYKR